jgi:hypothetical protein
MTNPISLPYRNILHKIKHKTDWIGQILRRNSLLKHIDKEKIEEGIEVTGGQGRRRK